jgi:hypothetical protein
MSQYRPMGKTAKTAMTDIGRSGLRYKGNQRFGLA